jgi:SAM-dependent methyltransferase
MNTQPALNPPHRAGLRQRLFAWATSHAGDYLDAVSLARKRRLLGGLHGDILEIGPGAGPNLRYYPVDVRWTGVEPNPFMHSYLQKTISELGRPPERYRIDPGDAGGVRLPAADASLDAVVSTLVLCSVPHPEDSLREILRVLKPGGRFVFIEHVAAPAGTRLRNMQNFVQPLWSAISDGCHPNRETWGVIQGAGFAAVDLEHFVSPGGNLAGPHIAGTALKGI